MAAEWFGNFWRGNEMSTLWTALDVKFSGCHAESYSVATLNSFNDRAVVGFEKLVDNRTTLDRVRFTLHGLQTHIESEIRKTRTVHQGSQYLTVHNDVLFRN